jgi:hypothetical protein
MAVAKEAAARKHIQVPREIEMFRTATSIFAILLVLTLPINHSIATPPVVDHTPEAVSADGDGPLVVINAPDKVEVGDMIVIDVSESKGKGFDLEIIPKPPKVRVFNDGSIICCGTGDKNITYLVIVSCAEGDLSDVETKEIKVVGGNNSNIPDTPGSNLVDKVVEWCEAVDSSTLRDDALKLSQSFRSLAGVIESGAFNSVSELVQATLASNQDALGGSLENWDPFSDALSAELKAMSAAGMLPDVKSHGPVWRAVADGLQKFASEIDDIPDIGVSK